MRLRVDGDGGTVGKESCIEFLRLERGISREEAGGPYEVFRNHRLEAAVLYGHNGVKRRHVCSPCHNPHGLGRVIPELGHNLSHVACLRRAGREQQRGGQIHHVRFHIRFSVYG